MSRDSLAVGRTALGETNPDITLIVMTRNRVDELLPTLGRLISLSESPPVIVVDNGSTDGTPPQVERHFPEVDLIALASNTGVAARNIAVERASTPYGAFNEDDSWWEDGALRRVVRLFDANPTLGGVTARIIVEPNGRDDPISVEMEGSPVSGDPSLPGTPVLGFLACATALRRSAFLEVGGFESRLHFGGEEELLATDLRTAGWEVRYAGHACAPRAVGQP